MLRRQVAECLIQAGNDGFGPGNQITALRHIHGPEFPGPFEYIPENVPVNGLEATYIEMPRKGPFEQIGATQASPPERRPEAQPHATIAAALRLTTIPPKW
jgi:hypothetical protein